MGDDRNNHIGWRMAGNTIVLTAFISVMESWFRGQDNDIAQSFARVLPFIYMACLLLIVAAIWGRYLDKKEEGSLSSHWWNKSIW